MSDQLIAEILHAVTERAAQPEPTPNGAFGAGTIRQLCYEELVARLSQRPSLDLMHLELEDFEPPQRELPEDWKLMIKILWPGQPRRDIRWFDTTELPWAMAGKLERLSMADA